MTFLAVLTTDSRVPTRPLASLRSLAVKAGIACTLLAAAVGAHAATVVKFATATANSAAILSDGTLWTWGNNMNGQLGNGTSVSADKPIRVGTGFTQVAVGSRYMVALKADGSLWMWGHAVLKDREFYETAPVQIGSGFDKLLTSDTAAKADGTVWFWGDARAVYSAPAGGSGSLDPLPAGYQQMVTGPYNALFVLDGGALRYISTNHLFNTWRTAYGSNGPAGSDFVQVALNTVSAAGVKKDGSLWQWKGIEQPASLGTGYGQVAKGAAHTVALKTDGSVWAWGSNANGQLGTESAADAESPQLVGNGYTQIAAASQHTLALKADGTLVAWGSNSRGQLGAGQTGAESQKPTPVVFDAAYSPQPATVTASGPTTRMTLTAKVQIANEHLGNGVQGNAFVVAIAPTGAVFAYNGSTFVAINALSIPAAWTNGLKNTSTALFTDQDLTAMAGSAFFVGYGLGATPSESLGEMLTSKRYQLGYVIQ